MSAALDNAAVDFLAQQNAAQEPANEQVETESIGQAKPEAAKATEEKKTPEQLLADAETARAEAATLRQQATDRLEKLNSQHAAFERRKKSLDDRESKIVEREKSIGELTSVQAITAHIARVRGISIDDVWSEWAEEIRNGGKPSDATLLKREREAREREAKEREEQGRTAAANRQAQEEQAWGNEMDGILGAQDFATNYPRLAAVPGQLLIDSLLQRTREYQSQTGRLPDQTSLLKWLESQFPVAPAASTAAAKPKPKLPTSRDSNTGASNRPLTEAERDKAAIDFLASQPDE